MAVFEFFSLVRQGCAHDRGRAGVRRTEFCGKTGRRWSCGGAADRRPASQASGKEDQVWVWCRECLVESARFAADHGVTLALQNHRPIITGYKHMLRMIREVNSPHLKACMDAPLMEDKTPAYLRQAVHEVGDLQVQSHFGGDFEQQAPGAPIRQIAIRSQWRGPYDYGGYVEPDYHLPFVRALLEAGYRGYLGYELCHPLPVIDGRPVGLDYADRMAKLASEFIRSVIAQATKDLAEGKVSD